MYDELKPGEVLKAAERLQGIANRTPVLTSRTLNELCGCSVFLKCENFQRVGAFKFRGAYHALSRLSPEEKEAGVITHSSGNHAQGVALAAKLLGIPAVIVMPEDAPPVKREATKGYGAVIVPCQAINREKVTAALIERHGYTLIHPYDNSDIILGQGTAAAELFDEVGPLDLLFAPVGGGGLLSGSALAAAALSPDCRVVGVEPVIASDANQSWRENEIVTLDLVPHTIADGLRTRYIGQRNLAVMHRYVDDMLTVTEQEILDTMQFIWNFMKIIVEPSSVVAVAPLLSGDYADTGVRAGVIISGGNVSLSVAEIIGATKSGQADRADASDGPSLQEPHSAGPRVLVTDAEFDSAALAMLERVATVDRRHAGPEEEIADVPDEYQAIIIGPHQRVSDHLIENGYNLLAIGSSTTRLDNVDVSTARTFGVEACYVPDGYAVAIAEHTISRLLMLENHFDSGGLAGKTLGLVGYGQVSRQVAKRAEAFNMKVIANQPRLTPELAVSTGIEAVGLTNLVQRSDFISLHVPFNSETEALIGRNEFANMKDTAFLINPSHTDLVDEAALLEALENGQIAGAALSELPDILQATSESSEALRRHERVIVSPHVTSIIRKQRQNLSLSVATQIVELLERVESSKALPLELVSIEQVTPHEDIDDKRVRRLMARLEADGRLVNPPITTYWKGRYVVLDGATRYSALKRLGFRYIIVQVVDPQQSELQLHTWYHAISNAEKTVTELYARLNRIEGLELSALENKDLRSALQDPRTLCYFLDREGRATLARESEGANRLTVMKEVVQAYSIWGSVERTLLTDIPRLRAQFPQLKAVAVFPQFEPDNVFDAARAGNFLPAGLTRFIIPGRILRLNLELSRLQRDESLGQKRAWFNDVLAEKLRHSRLRFYQEPVVLLDE